MNCRGMALLTGLLLMAAISLLAVTAAGSMTLQRHQAANYEDRIRAAAWAALARSHAQAWLFSRAESERQAGCSVDCLLPAGVLNAGQLPEQAAFETEAWWRANATRAGTSPATGEPVGFVAATGADALWLIEEVHYEPMPGAGSDETEHGIAYYRILARGKGLQPGSISISESIVARPWGGEYEPAVYPSDQPQAAFCVQFEASLPCGSLAWRERR